MPLIKPDATRLAHLQARAAGVATLHRDIASLVDATDLATLQRMADLVTLRLREMHPTLISEYEMLAFIAQVRGLTDVCRRVLADEPSTE